MIFNFFKKYWRRNRTFTFTPEVKLHPLIDSPKSYAINRDDYYTEELGTQLISHHASIFLGVILLAMYIPGPWKCPWSSSKKRKKRTKNDHTAMNEQAKVGELRRLDQVCKRSIETNLVPRVSHLTAWGERGETLVGSGHVSPRIWEITIKLLKGGAP